MPEFQFDLRLRRLREEIVGPRVRYRCVLLPHLWELRDGKRFELPWSSAFNLSPLPEGDPANRPDRGKLWVPPVGTSLEFTAPPVAALGPRMRRLTVIDDGTGLEPVMANGAVGPKLVCFEGMKLLLEDPNPEAAR